ncbi:MAG: DUF427 domain-containing protein [Anaerolineales bacterium]
MKPVPQKPAAGQESVWDYPRPPRLDHSGELVKVIYKGQTIAETSRSVRILETSLAPSYYIPPEDVNFENLKRRQRTTWCEWKGQAHYFDVVVGEATAANAGWAYPDPTSPYEEIRDYLSFYPSRVDCFVDGEMAEPQPGGFYGGWVTSKVVGPFKGEPGTERW